MNLDISKYCNKKIPCTCGKIHYCPISEVVVEKDALQVLPQLLRAYKHIYLVADKNTYKVCGKQVEKLLKKQLSASHVYERNGVLIPNEDAVEECYMHMPQNTDLVLGVGSGVINDICKYVTWHKQLECAIVATAPSMDGYASSGAAMIVKGMKVTYTTHPPKYIVADIDIVKTAPMNMIQSGYGDIIGKYSSLNDWKLSQLITGEYFCQEVYDIVLELTNQTKDAVHAIMQREDLAIGNLMKALVFIGVTLSLVESTRPGSGSEHHLAHFFEVVGLLWDEPHFSHGTNVGYTTILTARMREEICKQAYPKFHIEKQESREKKWQHIYGEIEEEVKKLQRESENYVKDWETIYTEKWEEIQRLFRECPTANECKLMLEQAGLDIHEFETMYGKDKIVDAMLYGKDLKDRYSVLWIYYWLFSGKRDEVKY